MNFRVLIHLQTYPKIFLCILGGVWGGLKLISKNVSRKSSKNSSLKNHHLEKINN